MNRTCSLALVTMAACYPQTVAPEDPQLRSEAVHLLERAVMLTTPVWPANEESFQFRVMNPAPGEARDGTVHIGISAPAKKRWEYTYGSYRFVQVRDGMEFATYRTASTEPAVVTAIRKILPVYHGQFDSGDLIRKIADTKVDGSTTTARCIEFETIKGASHETGQVCVEAGSGHLLSVRQGNETIRQSAYYRFNDAWLPGHLERWVGGDKIFEVDSQIVVRTEYPPDYFAYPAEATISTTCRAFHRAFADQTPQPEVKTYSQESVTVKVHGRVGKDGKPNSLKVLSAGVRQDLAEEALRRVGNWTFHAAQCEYQPATQEMDFEVTFQGW